MKRRRRVFTDKKKKRRRKIRRSTEVGRLHGDGRENPSKWKLE